MGSAPNTSALVTRLRAGDRHAFDELYATYERRIHAFLYRQCGQRDVADDLFQECWLRVARHAPTLREDTDVPAWLFTIARNLERSRRRYAFFDRLRGRDQSLPEAVTPERQASTRQRVANLERALAELQPASREVLLLVAVDELTPTQAAQVLGLAAEAARKRLSRARQELAARMMRIERS